MHNPFRYFNSVVTLLNGRAANWLRTQAQAAAAAVCHRPIVWLRNWRNVFREIRWRWALKGLCQVNLIDSEISCNILFESSLRSLKFAPAERGRLHAGGGTACSSRTRAEPVARVCLSTRKKGSTVSRASLAPSFPYFRSGNMGARRCLFPSVEGSAVFAGRVNKLVAEVGRGPSRTAPGGDWKPRLIAPGRRAAWDPFPARRPNPLSALCSMGHSHTARCRA